MLFIALGVVRRSVMETRDFHVEVMHMHPDPRKMRSAKEDNLLLWNVSLVLWLVFLNLSSWAGSHSIARPPPIGADLGGLVFLHIASGALAFFPHASILVPTVYDGDSSGGIQSRLSRLLSEGQDSAERVHEVGKCPDCGVSSAASMDENGDITVLCAENDCGGRGEAGTECPECLRTLDDHLSCGSCGARTQVRATFFSRRVVVEQFMGVEFLVQVDLSEGDRENIGPLEESFTESKASSAFPYLITAISTLITALSISILALWLLSDENVIFGGPPSTLIAWQEDYERMTGMNDIPSNLDGTGVVICVVDSA